MDLACRCPAALDADRIVPNGAISLNVEDGHVTLRGDVRHRYERQAAEVGSWKAEEEAVDTA